MRGNGDRDPLPDRLPLTTVERFMLEDDRPSHPLTGVHELTVRGPLATADLAAAVEAARVRHPLLCRVIDPAGKRSAWVEPAALPDPPVTIDRGPVGRRLYHERGPWLDITREPGLRVWVRDELPDADGTPVARLTVAIHHCCADALGGLTFLFDLFAHLAAARGGPPVPPPPDVSRLRRRGGFYDREGRVPGLPPGRTALLGHLAVGLRRLSKKPSIPLAASDADAGLFDGHPAVDRLSPPRLATFSPEETTALRKAAKARGVTLNDLVLRDLFLSLKAHNARFGTTDAAPNGRPGFLRVSVPVNLRAAADLPGPGGAGLTVANKIGMALVTRPPGLADDPEALLSSLHEEMSWVRRVERGRRFVEAVKLAHRVVGRTPDRFVGEACFATAVLSNLGDLARVIPPALRDDAGRLTAPAADPADRLTVTSYSTAPPGRPLTRATVLAATYAGRLGLHLGTDPHAVAAADADALLADLAARVRRSAGVD